MRTSGEAVLSPCRLDEAESGPRGSNEAESGPRGSDEAESLRSCSIGNVVGTYQLYLIGYPSIRSPIRRLQSCWRPGSSRKFTTLSG